MIKSQLQQRPRRPMVLRFEDLPDEAFVPINIVMDVTGKRTTSIYEAINQKKFPAPDRFGSKCVRWRCGEIRRWLADPNNYARKN